MADQFAVQARARELHRRGVAAIGAARPIAGARYLRSGLQLLGWPDAIPTTQPVVRGSSQSIAARLLISLASAEVQVGNVDVGFGLLDHAADLVAACDEGVLLQQRGLLLMLVGRIEEALPFIDRAIPLLAASDEPQILVRTLQNRAMLHHMAGRIRLARADQDRCERAAKANGMHLEVAKVAHNRAFCELLEGDIPAALRAFETAIQGYREHGAQWVAVAQVDLARALLAAGLPGEAADQLDAAMGSLRRQRLSQEWAEAELFRAHAALATGQLAAARSWARRAERRFLRRGNETWAATAALTRHRADFYQRRRLASVATGAAELAARLHTLQRANHAESAALLACRAHLALGHLDEARQSLGRVRRPKLLENRLQRRLALAELGAVCERSADIFTHARAGLALLAEHRSRFGSLDLQTGTATLGTELAEAGLAAALDRGTPAQVFTWLERRRAQAFTVAQVRPTADADTIAAVAELRQLARVVRKAELNGHREPRAQRRCAELERQIRARGWQVDGTGRHAVLARLSELTAELARVPAVMLSFLVRAGELLVLAISDRSARLVRLGSWSCVAEPAARLRIDLDTMCGRRLPAALDAVIRGSIRRQLDTLTGILLAPLRSMLAEHDVVVVPTRTLSALPWGLLPDLRGRPVVVAPSASSWLQTRRREPPDWSAQQPLLVAGPNLRHADAEVAAIAEIYPNSTILSGDAATVRRTLNAIDGRGIVHLSAHGHHEQDNVLFSRLELIDGPLMAYDIHQLATAPAHVVLASCDIGRAVVRAGDELLGFTAALLYGGTRSVVSSASRVADDVSITVMSAYHRALASGAPPARALADAAASEPLVPFICFGS
jgi:tetratricopeptide (TPR) repeat protein